MNNQKAHGMRLHKKALIAGAFLIINGTLLIQSTHSADESSASDPRSITNMSIAQIVRSLIGLPQKVAAGGSRSGIHKKSYICLISPAIKILNKRNIASTSISNPIIITGSNLNEFKIREADGNKKILFKARSSSKKTIETPIKWPIKPIEPDEKYILEFRDEEAAASEKIEVILFSEDLKQMTASRNLIEEFKSAETSKERKIEILKESSSEIKMNLIFSLDSENIQHWKKELAKGCQQ